MRSIVTNPLTDYINVSDFDVLADYLQRLINEACRTQSPGPSTVSVTVVPTTGGLT